MPFGRDEGACGQVSEQRRGRYTLEVSNSADLNGDRSTMTTTRQQHQAARNQAVIGIARYGYLRASDIALLVYFDKLSGVRLAQRLLTKLHADSLVLRREGRTGEEHHYALSERGALEATRLTGVHYSSGKDLLRSISAHRDGANRICALAQAAGYEVLTDREICRNPDRVFLEKVPDALIIENGFEEWGMARTGYTWIEVEHSYRSTSDLDKLARFVLRIFESEHYCVAYRDGWLDELHLVVSDTVAASIGRRLYKRLTELMGEETARQLFASRLRVLTL